MIGLMFYISKNIFSDVHFESQNEQIADRLSLVCVCAGVVRGHKTEGQDLFYNVEKDGQKQWYNRTAVILSLEQGNKLREQHSLGPYEPSTPLAKASDISLGKTATAGHRRMCRDHRLTGN